MRIPSDQVLEMLWQMSWQGGAIAIIVLLLQRTLGRFISHRWRHALWMLVLLRLLMPVLPHSRFGLLPSHTPFARADEPRGQIQITQVPLAPVLKWEIRTGRTDSILAPQAAPVLASPPLWQKSSIWMIGWLSIAVVLLAIRIASNFRFQRRENRFLAPIPQRLIDLLHHACGQFRMRRMPEICVTRLVDAPAVTGLTRSRILLPAGSIDRLSDEQLHLVLLHELSHIACGDVAIDWLWAVLTSLHWFNPILWAIGPIRRNDRELARDEMVLSLSGQPQAYGQLLLELSQPARLPAFCPGLIGMMTQKNRLKRRVRMVARFDGNHWYSAWIGLILLAAGSGCMLTAPLSKAPAPVEPSTASVNTLATMPMAVEADFGDYGDVPDEPMSERDRATVNALNQKIADDLRFNANRLSDVLALMAEKTHTNIYVDWAALQRAGIQRDAPVTARIRNLKYAKTLSLIFKSVEGEGDRRLGFAVNDGVITISMRKELDKNIVTRQYDINDLLLATDWTYVPDPTDSISEFQAKARAACVASIRKEIMADVEPPTWKDNGGSAGTIETSPTLATMLITQTPRAHRKIQRVLDALSGRRSLQISVETRIISLPLDAERQLTQDIQNRLLDVRDAGQGRGGEFLTDADVTQLLRCVEKNPGRLGLTAPRLTLFNGQTGTVDVATQQAYIGDKKRLPASTTQPAHYEPVAKTTTALGISLKAQTTSSVDRGKVFVDLHTQITRLIKLMPETFGRDPSMGQIQRPVLEVTKIDNAFAIPDRLTLLLACPWRIDAGDETVNADSPDKARDDAEVEKLRRDSHMHQYLLIKPTLLKSK